jgi:hypothetical protein
VEGQFFLKIGGDRWRGNSFLKFRGTGGGEILFENWGGPVEGLFIVI